MKEPGAFARVSKLAEESVHALLREKKTISVMESCTGGLVASLLTDISGASEVFPCGLATYSNAAKELAGVDAKLIEKEGVYSAACAEAMARAVQKMYGTDYAIGVTGTLGRVDPANKDSTPGEVFFCILRSNPRCTVGGGVPDAPMPQAYLNPRERTRKSLSTLFEKMES